MFRQYLLRTTSRFAIRRANLAQMCREVGDMRAALFKMEG